ncbi:MAG: EAL domain-containing protein [Sulfuricaulis sp.]|nr:EAL domain-containing protein [Sulfuricaulis sp.]
MHGFPKVDKEKVLELRSKGLTPSQVAKRLDVTVGSVWKVFREQDGLPLSVHEMMELFQSILGNMSDGVLIVDTGGAIKMCNPVAERLFGYPEGDLLEHNISLVFPGLCIGQEPAKDIGPQEIQGARKGGATFQVESIVRRTAHGKQSMFIVIVRDGMDRRQAEQRLIYLAHFDALTGLPTRSLFLDRANHALARAGNDDKLVAIMYVDLDHFKTVNDDLGHHAGDQLLKATAERITSCLREVDTVSRMGGDEFTIILESIPHIDIASMVAQKLLEAMHESFRLEGHEVHITASIGITIYPFDDKDLNGLLKDADQAMYRAKQAGRNCYQFFDATMTENTDAIRMTETQIEHALERNELHLYYQPRVDLSSGCITGVEALLRWAHPQRGLLAADSFIPSLERSRMIYAVDEWVLHTACAQNQHWEADGLPPMRVIVNISPYRLRRKGLAGLVSKVLKETGLKPEQLELDVPAENLVGTGKAKYNATLCELRALGIHIALADCASDNPFLDARQRLPVDVMKIDRSFVQNISVDSDQAELVQAIVALARAKKLKVVAEGVETEEQLDILRHYGCDMIQGFLFSKPVASEELTRLLQEGKRLV